MATPLLTLKPKTLSPENVSGIAMISNCLCVLEDNLWMFNLESGKSKKHPKTGEMTWVDFTSIASMGNNTLVITDDNNTLHFLGINPDTLEITQYRGTPVPVQQLYGHCGCGDWQTGSDQP